MRWRRIATIFLFFGKFEGNFDFPAKFEIRENQIFAHRGQRDFNGSRDRAATRRRKKKEKLKNGGRLPAPMAMSDECGHLEEKRPSVVR